MLLFGVVFMAMITRFIKGNHIPHADDTNKKSGLIVDFGGVRTNLDLDKIHLEIVAQEAANQAYTALSSQVAAANQAAYTAKIAFAERASRAAVSAQVALITKFVLIDLIGKQRSQALDSFEADLSQLKLANSMNKTAFQIAQQASKYATRLAEASRSAEQLARQAAEAAQLSEDQLVSQSRLIIEANEHLKWIDNKMKTTQTEFANAQKVAVKAFEVARIAYRSIATTKEAAKERDIHHSTSKDYLKGLKSGKKAAANKVKSS